MFAFLLALALVFASPREAPAAESMPVGVARYAPDVIRASHAFEGLQGYPTTRIAQMWQESKGRTDARSPVGARGLFQFMPATERWLGEVMPDIGVPDALNPRWAIIAGVRYEVRLEAKHKACPPMARVWYGLREYNGGGLAKDLAALEAAGFARCDFVAAEQFNGRRRSAAAIRENINYPRQIVVKWEPKVRARFPVRGVGG